MKNYYRYAPLIYSDPKATNTDTEGFMRDYSMLGMGIEELRIAMNKVAKYATLKLVFSIS